MKIKRLAYLSNIYITKAPLGFAGGGAELGVALRASERLIESFLGWSGTFICLCWVKWLREALRGF